MIAITGASDGLGLALAQLYKDAGKKVVNISRRESPHADVNLLHNLRDGDEIKKAAEKVAAIDEPLEAIVQCAGVMSIQPLGEITDDEVKRVMTTNIKAQILLVSNLIDRIKKDGTDIVNVASTVGTKAYKDQAAYGASKWAVRGFSENLQLELKNYPSRVISFLPGGFQSKIFEKATGTDNTGDGTEWMCAEDVALVIKQTLDLPKNMEVSEIIINRKNPKK